jgi:cold shock CspA family protein
MEPETLAYDIDDEAMQNWQATGTCKKFGNTSGFGFITAENGPDVFVHITDCIDGMMPVEGDVLTYELGPSTKKPGKMAALNVTGGSTKQTEEERREGKGGGGCGGKGPHEGEMMMQMKRVMMQMLKTTVQELTKRFNEDLRKLEKTVQKLLDHKTEAQKIIAQLNKEKDEKREKVLSDVYVKGAKKQAKAVAQKTDAVQELSTAPVSMDAIARLMQDVFREGGHEAHARQGHEGDCDEDHYESHEVRDEEARGTPGRGAHEGHEASPRHEAKKTEAQKTIAQLNKDKKENREKVQVGHEGHVRQGHEGGCDEDQGREDHSFHANLWLDGRQPHQEEHQNGVVEMNIVNTS